MKRFCLFVILFSFFSCLVLSQNIDKETEKLHSLGKVWGFLKYYHPEVAKGNYDWDQELIKMIPKVIECKNKENLSRLYLGWINSLGKVKVCKKCNSKNDAKAFNKNFDLSWLENTRLFTRELSEKLKYIEVNRFRGKPYYVASAKLGFIEITNEKLYDNSEFPNESNRLLGLFKYWNVIEYFYPYKYLTDIKWDTTLTEMIPVIQDVKNVTEYHLVYNEIVARLNDGHGYLQSKYLYDYFGNKYLPFLLSYDEDRAVVTRILNDSLAKLNNIDLGDILISFNGKKISTLFNENKKYVNASNYKTLLRNASNTYLRGSDSAKLIIRRGEKIFDNNIALYSPYKLYDYKAPSKLKWEILEGNIGYVNMANVKIKEVPKMMGELKNTEALIFDVRYYPNFIFSPISKYLLTNRKAFVKRVVPDLSYPGKYIFKEGTVGGNSNNVSYKGKIIVLVNENTKSRGEYTVMALQAVENVTTIGGQTAGADGEVSRFELIKGVRTGFTGVGIYYPNGGETQRKGVQIDVMVEFSLEDFVNGEDTILNEALLFINESKSN